MASTATNAMISPYSTNPWARSRTVIPRTDAGFMPARQSPTWLAEFLERMLSGGLPFSQLRHTSAKPRRQLGHDVPAAHRPHEHSGRWSDRILYPRVGCAHP
jgi:hypothetical protein